MRPDLVTLRLHILGTPRHGFEWKNERCTQHPGKPPPPPPPSQSVATWATITTPGEGEGGASTDVGLTIFPLLVLLIFQPFIPFAFSYFFRPSVLLRFLALLCSSERVPLLLRIRILLVSSFFGAYESRITILRAKERACNSIGGSNKGIGEASTWLTVKLSHWVSIGHGLILAIYRPYWCVCQLRKRCVYVCCCPKVWVYVRLGLGARNFVRPFFRPFFESTHRKTFFLVHHEWRQKKGCDVRKEV